jgi:hypothetical protein
MSAGAALSEREQEAGHTRIFAIPPRVESLSKSLKACKMPQNRPLQ